MNKLYQLSDGEWVDHTGLCMEFIESIDKLEEFKLFKTAIVDEELTYNDVKWVTFRSKEWRMDILIKNT